MLRQQVNRLQGTTSTRPLPTHPMLSPVLRLRTGVSYATDSVLLALLLAAGPSEAGAWTAVVGVPELGVEAARSLGVALERTLLVPDPGSEWLTVTGVLAEVMGVVLVRPPAAVPPSQVERLTARLRQRETVLVVLDERGDRWSRAEARLSLREPVWSGLGSGHGRLVEHRATIEVATDTSGRRRRTALQLSDPPFPHHPSSEENTVDDWFDETADGLELAELMATGWAVDPVDEAVRLLAPEDDLDESDAPVEATPAPVIDLRRAEG